ncbi:uncharacterized protein LOC120655625 isoform X4 [Panicum virgatum]|uniref:uncharacterized protein LOC120655625 isoform X4 n=1 Tax=Panicum virgatum TaxID=38727 RepID=UPI0019D61026|nr:uncharacterized protein LOC120655625 isoform X4 [Panicum virgatum]
MHLPTQHKQRVPCWMQTNPPRVHQSSSPSVLDAAAGHCHCISFVRLHPVINNSHTGVVDRCSHCRCAPHAFNSSNLHRIHLIWLFLTEPASAGSNQPKKAQPNGLDHLLYLLHSVPDGRGTVPNAAAAVQHEYTTQSYPLAHGQVALVTIPNGLGVLFAVAQLVLYAIYYKSTQQIIEARKRKAGQVALTEVVVDAPATARGTGPNAPATSTGGY